MCSSCHVCVVSVAGIPMELIIIVIIGVVLIISICICVCILGQTLVAKRRQPNPNLPHFNTDTMHTQPTQYGDGGHIPTSSWMCSYSGEQRAKPHIWETPLPVPGANQEGEYTLPANMRQQHDQKARPTLPNNTQPASQMLTTSGSSGEYTAPVVVNPDDQQHAAAVPPQPMPEYTLPIKKEIRESSPAHSADVPSPDDYLQPITVRPEPLGANNVQKQCVSEGSSLKNAGYRPDSVMAESVAEDAEAYMNAEAESSDALLQAAN